MQSGKGKERESGRERRRRTIGTNGEEKWRRMAASHGCV
jgi:hypothetical protein